MVKLLEKSYKNGCCKRVEQWTIDTDAELASLPAAPPGSYAISAESGITFYANTSGEWPKDPSKYESGGSGGGGSYNAEFDFGDTIPVGVFTGNDNLIKVNFPNVTHIKNRDFGYCSRLETVDLPNATSIGEESFIDCYILKNVNFPNATSIGVSAFSGCMALKTIDLPNATSIGGYAFSGCNTLTMVDFPNVTSIGEMAFMECGNFKTLILRSETLCNLNLSAIVGTKIITAEGMPTGEGFVYVPSALYNDYIADWIPQVIALGEMGGMSIDEATATYMITMILRKLEDYTVDGTTTGELDESKI